MQEASCSNHKGLCGKQGNWCVHIYIKILIKKSDFFCGHLFNYHLETGTTYGSLQFYNKNFITTAGLWIWCENSCNVLELH